MLYSLSVQLSVNCCCLWLLIAGAKWNEQEAQLSPRNRAMRRWNFANCHATVQKLLYDKIVLYTEVDDLCDKLQWSKVGARRYYKLSWPTTAQFITLWASTFFELSWQHASTIDMSWRNILSPEFGAKFQREVPLFLKIHEFSYNTV